MGSGRAAWGRVCGEGGMGGLVWLWVEGVCFYVDRLGVTQEFVFEEKRGAGGRRLDLPPIHLKFAHRDSIRHRRPPTRNTIAKWAKAENSS